MNKDELRQSRRDGVKIWFAIVLFNKIGWLNRITKELTHRKRTSITSACSAWSSDVCVWIWISSGDT